MAVLNGQQRLVLLVDDELSAREPLKLFLESKGYTVLEASSVDGAILHVNETGGRNMVAIVDINLFGPVEFGDKAGLAIIGYIKQVAPDRVHVRAYTGDTSDETENKAMLAGAKAVIHKPRTPSTIIQHIEAGFEELEARTIDALTGLYNSRFLIQSLRAELDAMRRRHEPKVLRMIMTDLDDFKKSVNEPYGWLAGTQAIVKACEIQNEHTRPMDQLVRYGGDECVLALPGMEESDAIEYGLRLQQALASAPIRIRDGIEVQLKLSFGVGSIRYDEVGPDIDAAIQKLFDDAKTGPNGLTTQRMARGYVGRGL